MPRPGYKLTSQVGGVKTFREEGVVKTKRNYVLYQSGLRKVKEPEPKPEPPKPKPKPKPKPQVVKRTQIIDNYNYYQSEHNTKMDPKRKSITIHKRLSEPFVKETYEEKMVVEAEGPKLMTKPRPRPMPKPRARPAVVRRPVTSGITSGGDNYQYHETRTVRKEKHQSDVIHKRRSGAKY